MKDNQDSFDITENASGDNSYNPSLNETVESAKTDLRINYPDYKSFDEFIESETLKSLDEYVTERIKRHIRAQSDDFFYNYYRLDSSSPATPGAREIWLSKTNSEYPHNYLDIDKPQIWHLTKQADEFSLLMDFIYTLPFKTTGRMLIIYDESATSVPAHRDHIETEVCHDFVWFRTNLRKPFYLLNHKTNQKKYVESYSAWFDTVNQFHGADACEGLSFSIRVDGVFTDEFKSRIPKPEYNLASTPALWASLND